MTKKRGSLGRGLSAILGYTSIETTAQAKQENTSVVGKTHEILLIEIETNPFLPELIV